jgi:hypothetical protein
MSQFQGATWYPIKSVDSGQLVAKGIRTENNVYVLKEEK